MFRLSFKRDPLEPVNFLIVEDVSASCRHLSFSKWISYTPMRKQGILERIDDHVSSREMPLPRYHSLHPEAMLSDTQVTILSEWAICEQDRVIQEDILNMEKGSE